MKKEISTLIFIILGYVITLSQPADYKRAYHWFFGDSAGLDFSSGVPVYDRSNMYAYEGCAAISDRDGNLLFYTNGGGRDSVCPLTPGIPFSPWTASGKIKGAIWQSDHNIMMNGYMTGQEGGGYSSGQSSLIVPKPGTIDEYYVFTTCEAEFFIWDPGVQICTPAGNQANKGVAYFEVDMSQNGGNGNVTVRDITLLAPSMMEALAGTVHANGTDYWIATMNDDQDIHLYQITSSGIQPPIIRQSTAFRNFKFSPDASLFMTRDTLYDFNNSTGNLSNPRGIDVDDKMSCFSPNSRFLYCNDNKDLYQFDVSLGSTSAIDASKTLVGTLTNKPLNKQIGPDGKIYMSHFNQYNLSVINCPNSAGTDCDMQDGVIALSTLSLNGLPNFIDAWFASDDSCGSPVLPVVLTDFAGYNSANINYLTWTTASEENNDCFIIEKSSDGKEYSSLKIIKGKGFTSSNTKYSTSDNNPEKGITYYRLKQKDFDGKVSLLKTISIQTSLSNTAIDIYPNPVSDILYLNTDNEKAKSIQLSIFDITGRTIVKKSAEIHQGKENMSINISMLEKGMYILHITNCSGRILSIQNFIIK